jgi:hypothetical protein
LSHEIQKFAEAEAVSNVEGNMCGTVLRGADALPGSKTASRRKGARRNLGDPASDRWQYAPKVRIGKATMPTPMMYGRGKSDEAIVARKPANKAEHSAAEPVERRAEAKGNAHQQNMLRTQCRISMGQALATACVHRTVVERLDPRWEPYAGKPHVRFCAGGAQQ